MTDEYITLDQAAEVVGVSRPTLWRRLKREEIQVYQSQQDRRIRLVRRADLEPLLGVRPVMPVIDQPAKTAA